MHENGDQMIKNLNDKSGKTDNGKLENFDTFARDYKIILDKSLTWGGEKGEYYAAYKAAYLGRRLGKNFRGKILDYGCGVGLLAEELRRQFPDASVDGFDVSAASIELIPDHLKKRGYFTSQLNDLSQSYDVMVVANVLHHIEASERQVIIRRLKALIKAEGKIIIFEHNPLNPLTRKIVRDSPLDRGVVLLPSTETLFYLKEAGAQDTQLNYIVFFPKFLSALRWAEPFLSWLPLGAQYVAHGHFRKII